MVIADGYLFRSQTPQLFSDLVRSRPTSGVDHPMPGKVRGVLGQDPPYGARRAQPRGRGQVTVGGHPPGRNSGEQLTHPLHLLVVHRPSVAAAHRTQNCRPTVL